MIILPIRPREARIDGVRAKYEKSDGTRFRITEFKLLGVSDPPYHFPFSLERRGPRDGRFRFIKTFATLAEAKAAALTSK